MGNESAERFTVLSGSGGSRTLGYEDSKAIRFLAENVMGVSSDVATMWICIFGWNPLERIKNAQEVMTQAVKDGRITPNGDAITARAITEAVLNAYGWKGEKEQGDG